MDMLKEKSVREYQRISVSIARDIAVLYSRHVGMPSVNFSESVRSLVNDYARYYQSHNIEISLVELANSEQTNGDHLSAEVFYIRQDQRHLIHLSGELPEPFRFFRFDYYYDITENIEEMQYIQRILLLICIIFSALTAIVLYLVLLKIFKPLDIVAKTSRKIASGQYNERINIKGSSELFSMAFDFNKMAEEVEKQMKLLEEEAVGKQQFIDNFAHEMRTPLTSIYGYAEYIQKTPFDEKEIIESTQLIMDEANHMKKIANSLLELATLRNYTPNKVEINTNRLFDDVKHALKKTLSERKAQLHCKSDVDMLEGQEDLIKSLLLNLCINAIKSTEHGNGIIYLKAEQQSQKIVLSVADNGCGISNDDILKMAEPFFTVDKSRSKEQSGIGLGMTLCKQIVDVHEAEMIVESSVNVGTTVKITFTNP